MSSFKDVKAPVHRLTFTGSRLTPSGWAKAGEADVPASRVDTGTADAEAEGGELGGKARPFYSAT